VLLMPVGDSPAAAVVAAEAIYAAMGMTIEPSTSSVTPMP
jgi:hypothetical protein